MENDQEADRQRPKMQASKTVRLGNVEELLRTHSVHSQKQLQELLQQRGIWATQATLSRDLLELGATKQRTSRGGSVYSLSDWDKQTMHTPPADPNHPHLAKWAQDLLVSSAVAGNMIVLRTSTAGAQLLARGLDQAWLDSVLGCVAGENTVLVICRDEKSAMELDKRFQDYIYR